MGEGIENGKTKDQERELWTRQHIYQVSAHIRGERQTKNTARTGKLSVTEYVKKVERSITSIHSIQCIKNKDEDEMESCGSTRHKVVDCDEVKEK
jgi:hypothetical protein